MVKKLSGALGLVLVGLFSTIAGAQDMPTDPTVVYVRAHFRDAPFSCAGDPAFRACAPSNQACLIAAAKHCQRVYLQELPAFTAQMDAEARAAAESIRQQQAQEAARVAAERAATFNDPVACAAQKQAIKNTIAYERQVIANERSNPSGVMDLTVMHDAGEQIQIAQLWLQPQNVKTICHCGAPENQCHWGDASLR